MKLELRQVVDIIPHIHDLRFSLYNQETRYRTYVYANEIMKDFGVGEGNHYSNLLIKIGEKDENRTVNINES